jgi:hypothetical protein
MLAENVDYIGDTDISIHETLTDVPYNAERGLYDKQPVWCWDDDYIAIKVLNFYDAQDDMVFDMDGSRSSVKYTNMEPVTPAQLETMPFIWDMYLKLKD